MNNPENKKWTQLWLQYKAPEGGLPKAWNALLRVSVSGFDPENRIVKSALEELRRGVFFMTGKEPEILPAPASDVSCAQSARGACLVIERKEDIAPQGYRVRTESPAGAADSTADSAAGGAVIFLEAPDENGLLYGIFRLLFSAQLCGDPEEAAGLFEPDAPLRMLNHWDNMDGSIERGYSGRSFFFKDSQFLGSDRIRDYARIVSSVGINAVVINNVNVKDAASYLVTERYYEDLARVGGIFADYGIKLFISINFAAPMEIGGLSCADPLDESVAAWWQETTDRLYAAVPYLGGFLVKADSEGRPGPFTYGRTQADGANMLARCVKPHGGCILWRCFVYNCTQDWRDKKTDRARAGYDNFIDLDGKFDDNVILQIKNGPMDFQIREPVSPLIGGMTGTNQMLEVQIAQEYTGQQIDLCYLIPMFKEVLSFKTYCTKDGKDTVSDIVCGRTFGNRESGMCGMTAVCNTGDDACWTGDDLAAANLYGFGRLCFNNSLGAEQIAREWIGLTFRLGKKNSVRLLEMLLESRAVYEKYSAPLGIGWMVNPAFHYGPSVDGYEYSRWGTYHRADHLGLGVDRTDSGTGYVRQYHEPNASMYNDPGKCPQELLLFFHHLPYTFLLPSGKTLIQHIYDSHFEGAQAVLDMQKAWDEMEGEVDAEVFLRVKDRFERQRINAFEWRDQVNSYFYRKSGIPDEAGREIF